MHDEPESIVQNSKTFAVQARHDAGLAPAFGSGSPQATLARKILFEGEHGARVFTSWPGRERL
jgi:hypothetical protein